MEASNEGHCQCQRFKSDGIKQPIESTESAFRGPCCAVTRKGTSLAGYLHMDEIIGDQTGHHKTTAVHIASWFRILC